MIVLHGLPSPRNLPWMDVQQGDPVYHLLSDRTGREGTRELLLFARPFGLHDAWMQEQGTHREHYDVSEALARHMRSAGAIDIDGSTVARILAAKKAELPADRIVIASATARQWQAIYDLHQRSMPGWHALMRQKLGAALRTLLSPLSPEASILLLLPADPAHGLIGPADINDPRVIALSLASPDLAGYIARAGLIIDASHVVRQPITPPLQQHRTALLANRNAQLISIQLPPGIDGEEALPTTWAVHADLTVAVGVPLRGATMREALPYLGAFWLADIGWSPRLTKQISVHSGHYFTTGSPIPLTAIDLVSPAESRVVVWTAV